MKFITANDLQSRSIRLIDVRLSNPLAPCLNDPRNDNL